MFTGSIVHTSCSRSVPMELWMAVNSAGRILLKCLVRASPATADKMASARVLTGGLIS